EDPVEAHPMLGIEPPLRDAIMPLVRGRKDLANPIRNDLDRTDVRIGESFSTNTHEIRANDVMRAELDVNVVQDPPATGAPISIIVVEGSTDEVTKRPLPYRVSPPHGGQRDEIAFDDLDLRPLFRQSQEIFVRRQLARCFHLVGHVRTNSWLRPD